MKAKIAIILVLVLMFSQYAHSKECPDSQVPDINLNDIEELFESKLYEKNVASPNLALLKYFAINSSMKHFDIENATISFTPSFTDIGKHSILILAVDKYDCYSAKFVTFSVYDKPRIYPLKPSADYITIEEGQNVLFAVDVEDQDNDIIDYTWRVNNEKKDGKDKFAFITDYNSMGIYNISLEVLDAKGLKDDHKWRVNVKEVNRKPYVKSGMPDYAVESGDSVTISSLDSYFGDADSDILKYSIGARDENGNKLDLDFSVENNELRVTSPEGFTGLIYIEITASDPSGNSAKTVLTLRVFGSQTEFDYTTIEFHVCGDIICGGDENCDNCESDCGPCTGGMSRCFNDWQCTPWSECIMPGFMIRECTDANQCYDQTRVPVTGQICRKVASCSDKILNQGERSVDCGGPCQPCPSCNDKKQNGGEEGVDCGGPCSTPCPTCDDSIQNQFESDTDCGGPCELCGDELKCYSWRDCKSHVCNGGFCAIPTCDDKVRNQDELGVDCQGVCGGVCPTCEDKIRNQDEEGVDCGGSCDPCPTCDDGVKNQGERYIDCGGECRICKWRDFDKYYPGRIYVILTVCVLFIIPLILLGIYLFGKKLSKKTSIEKLIYLNRFSKKKKIFENKKQVIEDTSAKLDDFIKRGLESLSQDYKEEIVKTLENFSYEVFGLDTANDLGFIRDKLKELGLGFPLNRIIIYFMQKSREIKNDKYLTGLEVMGILEKLSFIVDEVKKDT